ncbi:PadR family transcriptional regulator [Aestuariispira insulae]|uniref:PadR family transcriptional regulator n=1 Tax=Aestuariispira insulae TaxID=1461337 RepID=A0A3D9HVT0_9PROT|nr:PadR family transcriptional regulator [Aestuariispira insulae]RED53598.1 PadR family transcriptional regulator [Aestuariispira insulae]
MDIKTSCLGVLSICDASGYEIRKAFEDGPFSHFAEGGFGSIYPALNKMEADGLVTCTTQAQDKRPAKKVYSITTKGRLALMDALAKDPADDKYKSDFLFSMFFADFQSARRIERLIDDRISQFEKEISHLGDPDNECMGVPKMTEGADFVRRFGLHMHQAAVEFLKEEKFRAVSAALKGESLVNQSSEAAE